MTIAEKLAKEKVDYLIQCVLDNEYKFDVMGGFSVARSIMKEIIVEIAERGTKEACKGGLCNCYACELFRETIRSNRWWEEEA